MPANTSTIASTELPARFADDRLRLATEWLSTRVVRISAGGEMDASNTVQFATYVFRRAANSLRLVLDLNHVDFFGVEGFSILRTIGVRCSQAGVSWTLVPSAAVLRVLEICDPDRTIPRVDA